MIIYKEKENDKYKYGRYHKLLDVNKVEIKTSYDEKDILICDIKHVKLLKKSFRDILSNTHDKSKFVENQYFSNKKICLQSICDYFNHVINTILKENAINMDNQYPLSLDHNLTFVIKKTQCDEIIFDCIVKLEKAKKIELYHTQCTNIKSLFIDAIYNIKINNIDYNTFQNVVDDFANFISHDTMKHLFDLVTHNLKKK